MVDVLKNRIQNGEPFLRSRALERIASMLNNLEITQLEADELTAIANARGVDAMPEDVASRLGSVEDQVKDLTLAVADMIGGGVL